MTTEINGRKILFENEMCRTTGLMATCNCCDRIIFYDEMTAEQYKESYGYCPQCQMHVVYDLVEEYKSDPNCRPDLWIRSENVTEFQRNKFIELIIKQEC